MEAPLELWAPPGGPVRPLLQLMCILPPRRSGARVGRGGRGRPRGGGGEIRFQVPRSPVDGHLPSVQRVSPGPAVARALACLPTRVRGGCVVRHQLHSCKRRVAFVASPPERSAASALPSDLATMLLIAHELDDGESDDDDDGDETARHEDDGSRNGNGRRGGGRGGRGGRTGQQRPQQQQRGQKQPGKAGGRAGYDVLLSAGGLSASV